jgi:transcriptional regulator with XRE-family HTH domain
MSSLGERLSTIREQKGLTQGEVAQRAKLPQQAISRLERGDRAHVRSDVLVRIALALDVSLDVLMGLRTMTEQTAPVPSVQTKATRVTRQATGETGQPVPSTVKRTRARKVAPRA